jgi:putative DNA primase/helicase
MQYCSEPDNSSTHFVAIPSELRELRQWVCWKLEDVDGRLTKVPYTPRGQKASSTNPSSWSSFEECSQALHRKKFSGVGFVFAKDDPYTGIDLDHHRDPATGQFDDFAAWHLRQLNSYTEVSPSGTGAHTIVRATIPSKNGRRDPKKGVEMYSHSRFFCMTGQHVEGTPLTIEARQQEVEAMFREIFSAKEQSHEEPRANAVASSDSVLIERAGRAKNGALFATLWRGDWKAVGYGSQSEADAALLGLLRFWTGGDKERSCRLFAQSGLNRNKWKRDDYREATWAKIDHGQVYSPECKRGSIASECLGGETKSAAWPEPKPLPADLPVVPPFDFACLPETLRPWIEDISQRMQCPPDFPAVGAMTALGSLVGRKIGVRPKQYDDWLVIANLWGCVVGRPGVMKTAALEQPLAPLRRLVEEAFERFQTELHEHEVNALLKSQAAKLAEKKIAVHLKKGEQQAARIEAQAVLKSDQNGPVCRRYETNDPTIEKLGALLVENPNGLLLFRDEIVGFFRGLDREGHEGDRAIYLEMWNGAGSFTSDRIQRGTVRTPCILSILGGIQPDLLTAYVREAVRGGQGADGLLQRIQLFVWPDISKEWRNVDRWPDTESRNKAFGVFKYLADLTAEAVGADTTSGIPFLRFTHDAQERFDQWRTELEMSLRSDSEHPAFEAHLSKYRKLIPALALLIHLANRGNGPVTLAALNKAFLWGIYLEAHARRIYSAVLRPDATAARELAKHLQRGELPERFTLRETYRKGWAGISSKEDAEAATEILSDLGWIRQVAETGRTTGRPPSPAFQTNPKIRRATPSELTKPTKSLSGSCGSDSTETAPQNGPSAPASEKPS